MTGAVEAGTTIDGRYRVEYLLGSGGMADVYCATDLQLDRQVAVKLLYSRFAKDAEFVERFRREASAAAGLQHQHVVSVYDRGEWDGTYYIAMEYLQGRTLKAIINEYGALDSDWAIDMTTQILRAARFAHRRDVIHRDFKPHNVIVDDDGLATVTDFGIARAGASDMTQTGSIMGTAQYLSPEQAQGHAVNEQSDLYSIGVILYEMVTGQVPFDGESAVTIALKHVSEPAPLPSSINPAISPALDAVIMKALAKEQADRFATADEFMDALEQARAGVIPSGVPAPPVGERTIIGMSGSALAAGAVPTSTYSAGSDSNGEDDGPGRRWWIFAGGAVAAVGLLIVLLLVLKTEQVTVPRVVGSDEASAQATLVKAGFKTDTVVRKSLTIKGKVIAQNPPGGEQADKGSTVTLTVSDGPASVALPSVAGLSSSQARRRLENAGFTVRIRKQASDTVPSGDAVETLPPEGTPVAQGSTVTLVVSSGKATVEVPAVVGQNIDDARATLRGAGFGVSVTEQESTSTAGTVLRQDPGAGSKADKGSTIALVVAKAPATTKVPNTVGEDEASA
ncbi:MAG: Stk1 family PASTA domain-containing Ser/Thr kinase, partial [Actinobacteria bacterium]|nr:Stk1 family PASTA domain-containing Ser/Thr kinase [Actinomycetota bacterium]